MVTTRRHRRHHRTDATRRGHRFCCETEEEKGVAQKTSSNGFLVEWGEIDACWECSLSNGRCSHDDASASFVCICPDGRHSPRNCSELNHNTWTLVHSSILDVLLLASRTDR
ncbi:unnamed protein product [Musa hybrid cultivar]